ncbi:MAG TPA: winged-helix domain-containing protein, partial [Verrucomicrobiae bacterium]
MKRNLRAEIPRKAIYRLSVYFRGLQRLKTNGIRTVSSEALAKASGVKPTQLRKDLTYFG